MSKLCQIISIQKLSLFIIIIERILRPRTEKKGWTKMKKNVSLGGLLEKGNTKKLFFCAKKKKNNNNNNRSAKREKRRGGGGGGDVLRARRRPPKASALLSVFFLKTFF